MSGAVIEGTFIHWAVGFKTTAEVPLPRGAFYKVPVGVGHISKCVSDGDWVTFPYQGGKFDFIPVEQ